MWFTLVQQWRLSLLLHEEHEGTATLSLDGKAKQDILTRSLKAIKKETSYRVPWAHRAKQRQLSQAQRTHCMQGNNRGYQRKKKCVKGKTISFNRRLWCIQGEKIRKRSHRAHHPLCWNNKKFKGVAPATAILSKSIPATASEGKFCTYHSHSQHNERHSLGCHELNQSPDTFVEPHRR